MRKALLLFVAIIISLSCLAQDLKYSRVKIYCGKDRLPALLSLGIAPEGQIKKDQWMIAELSSQEIEKVKSAGYTVETLIEDLEFYYRDRNENSGKYPEEHSSKQMNCDATTSIVTPQHFTLGSMGGYYTLAEMLAQLDSMRLHYPSLITVKQVIGSTQTIGGRSLYYVKISDNPDIDETEPEVMYSALTHAREPMGMQALIFYMWYLLENYSSNAEIATLINNTEMYFVPCVNVDGYEYNRSTNPTGGGLWRKNRRNNGGSYGVDLNRNYGYAWGYDNVGSSATGSDETYRGTAGFSEAETSIMKWFCEQHSFKTLIDYHCYSNLLIYPWSYIADYHTPDSTMYLAYSALMTATNSYLAGTPNETVGYTGNGGSIDWFYGEQATKNKIICWSPEAGDNADGFWPASTRIEDIAKVNIEQNLYVARFAGRYANITETNSRLISQQADFFNFSLQRLGMEPATFTVTLIPQSANILSVGAAKTFSGMNIMDIRNDSIAFALQPSIQQGQEVVFVLQLDNGMYSRYDTIRKIYGTPVQIFSDVCSNTTNWTAGGWGTSTTQYHSASSSITDSPTGSYGNNLNKSITLTGTVDLTGKIFAQLNFWSKWDLELDYDYVQVKISTNGGTTWKPLCGKYTNAGTSDQILNSPLYDGTQTAWVKEEIDLSDYLNSVIKLRFTLVSDANTTADGFYFDDVEVLAINQNTTAIAEPAAIIPLSIYPNPARDLINVTLPTQSDYEYMICDIYGRTVISGLAKEAAINIVSLSKGIYLLRIIQDSQVLQGKFVK